LSHDGKLLAAIGEGDLHVWRTPDGAPAGEMHWEDASRLAFSPDGGMLAIGRPSGTVMLWDVKTRHERSFVPRDDGEFSSNLISRPMELSSRRR
jgi:WD40 repeat protein